MVPMPPADLRFNVSGTYDEAVFDQLGAISIMDFTRALAVIGRSFGQFTRILEWGCGCGRILRHMPYPPTGQEIHGCDIDPKGIDWLRENVRHLKLEHTAGLPPLPYADGHFDLIVNHSVLSHLDEAYQDAWLAELGRVLAPDGVLILTVHGDFAYDHWVEVLSQDKAKWGRQIAESRAVLDAHGIWFLVDDVWAANFPAYYQSTFHRPAYVFSHWSRFFDIASYIPRGSLGHQDMIVLRHRPAEAAAADRAIAA